MCETFGDLLDVVGDQHDGRGVGVGGETRETIDEFFAATQVEPGGRFVEQEQFGVGHQRARDHDTLALALRQRAEATVREVLGTHRFQRFDGLRTVHGVVALAIGLQVAVLVAVLAGEGDVAQIGAADRLAAAGEEAARLAMANEALAEANRRLIGPPGPEPDEIRRALEAEVDALRQARVAEIGQIGDIVDTLDRMIGDQGGADDQPGSEADPLGPADTGPAVIETPVTMSPASTAQVGQGGDAQMADETDQERG